MKIEQSSLLPQETFLWVSVKFVKVWHLVKRLFRIEILTEHNYIWLVRTFSWTIWYLKCLVPKLWKIVIFIWMFCWGNKYVTRTSKFWMTGFKFKTSKQTLLENKNKPSHFLFFLLTQNFAKLFTNSENESCCSLIIFFYKSCLWLFSFQFLSSN